MTALETALLLNVSRRTVYRWLDEGRLQWPLDRHAIERDRPAVRRRGPQRNPLSLRYTRGRHTFKAREDA